MLFCIKCWSYGFETSDSLFKEYLFSCNIFFCTSGYLFELIFALSTFWDKGVRVVAGSFVRSQILWLAQKFPVGLKFHFPKWKTYFTHFIDKFLKFGEMEYLIHHIKVEIRPALCRFSILFSAVKLKLEHNFSQFIYRFKIGTYEFWT